MKISIIWEEANRRQIYPIFADLKVKAARLRGPEGLFERFLKVIPEFIKKNFDSLGSRIGASWPPLSSDYAHWKKINYPGNQILVLSGHLRLASTIPNAPGNWVSWTGGVMLYGVDTSKFVGHYPKSHQFGASIPARTIVPREKKALHFFYKGQEVFAKKASPGPGRIPARPFMALAAEDINILRQIAIEYFKEKEKGQG